MALEKNQILFDLNDKIVKADTSSLNSLGNDNKSNLEILSNRIGGVLDGAGDDNWADEVKSGITSSIEKIKSNISKGIAASEFISGAVNPINNLKEVCKNYVEQFNAYSNLNEPYMYEQDNGADKLNSSGNKIVSSDYLEWAKKIESYESGIPQIEENALNVYEAVKNYFAAIDLNTNTLDSSIYAEGSASITFDFVNYFNGSI